MTTTTTTMIYNDNDEAMTAFMMMISSCSWAPLGSGTVTFASLLTMFAFSRAIAVNQKWVPTCPMTAKIIDPHDLSCSAEGIDVGIFLEVDLVNFSGTSNPLWLVGPHGLYHAPDVSWWREHADALPLLREIRDMIGGGKITRVRREEGCLVLVQVRGKTLLVACNFYGVHLALRGHPGAEPGSFEDATGILGWFLKELEKDMKALDKDIALQNEPAEGEAKSSLEKHNQAHQKKRKPVCDWKGDGATLALKEALGVLRAHTNVRRADWLPSRKSLSIKTWNGCVRDFRAITGKRRHTNWLDEDLRFCQAVCVAKDSALLWAERQG